MCIASWDSFHRSLAGIHALARVAEIGSPYWQQVADMASDKDELVRVGALRAVGRMAQPGAQWGGW